MLFDSEVDYEQRLSSALRVVKLREEQMRSAALCRNSGEIDSVEWDGFAARYASAVREWWTWQHYALQQRPALAETSVGTTYIHAA